MLEEAANIKNAFPTGNNTGDTGEHHSVWPAPGALNYRLHGIGALPSELLLQRPGWLSIIECRRMIHRLYQNTAIQYREHQHAADFAERQIDLFCCLRDDVESRTKIEGAPLINHPS